VKLHQCKPRLWYLAGKSERTENDFEEQSPSWEHQRVW